MGAPVAQSGGGNTALRLGSTLTNSGGLLNTTTAINAIGSATSYAILSSDMGKLVTHSASSPVAVTLSTAGAAGFEAGTSYTECNFGTSNVTITPSVSTINGAASLTLVPGQCAWIVSDGANWQAFTNGGFTNVISTNGAASTPALLLSGTIFTGGTGSTNLPQFLIQPAGTSASNWSVSGTMIGINAPSGFAGRLAQWKVNGTDKVTITNAGKISTTETFESSLTGSTVSGSVSGTAKFQQPLVGSALKEVVIYCDALNGTAAYTFPVAFTNVPAILTTDGLAAGLITALSTTAVTVTGAINTGYLFLKGT